MKRFVSFDVASEGSEDFASVVFGVMNQEGTIFIHHNAEVRTSKNRPLCDSCGKPMHQSVLANAVWACTETHCEEFGKQKLNIVG